MDAAIPGALAAETTAAGLSCFFFSAEADAVILCAAILQHLPDADVDAAADYPFEKRELMHLHQPSFSAIFFFANLCLYLFPSSLYHFSFRFLLFFDFSSPYILHLFHRMHCHQELSGFSHRHPLFF